MKGMILFWNSPPFLPESVGIMATHHHCHHYNDRTKMYFREELLFCLLPAMLLILFQEHKNSNLAKSRQNLFFDTIMKGEYKDEYS